MVLIHKHLNNQNLKDFSWIFLYKQFSILNAFGSLNKSSRLWSVVVLGKKISSKSKFLFVFVAFSCFHQQVNANISLPRLFYCFWRYSTSRTTTLGFSKTIEEHSNFLQNKCSVFFPFGALVTLRVLKNWLLPILSSTNTRYNVNKTIYDHFNPTRFFEVFLDDFVPSKFIFFHWQELILLLHPSYLLARQTNCF